MAAILVTGGAGFIGSHLCERLLSEGRRVVALDNFDPFYPAEVKRDNLERALSDPGFRFVEGDIRDPNAVEDALSGETVDAVIHLAARAGVRPSIQDPALYVSVNLDGTVTLLEACRKRGVGTFVFGSSSSVYGDNEKVPFSEDDPVDHPVSPYAATKRAGELLAHTYHHLFGLKVSCLRFFTVYGPRQRPDLAIHAFAKRIAAGEPIPVFGDGTSGRDYTYVDDIVEGIVRAARRTTAFHIWNLGGSHPVTLDAMIARLARGLSRTPILDRKPPQPGDVKRTFADISRARRELDWQPRVPFDEGIDRFLAWFGEKT
ncbi:MAG TPA: SDR family NAD(P)-dependent oxidoreductase [Candidatus Polarisedimenticolaceae bacterium]|nr:SDR family NAD(P)-dependent oxidoreductase [Candidatus Polarisedimenticolaceae bacterium]